MTHSAAAQGGGTHTGHMLGAPAPRADEALAALNALLRREAATPVFADAGGRPISVTLENLAAPRVTPYVVLEKTDGTHTALLLVRHSGVPAAWCITRGGDAWRLPLRAPTALFEGSLFEGELLVLASGPTLLLFKTLFIAGRDLRAERFVDRQSDAAGVFGTLEGGHELCPCAGLRIAAKHVAPLSDAVRVYNAAVVRGGCDGLVLVPNVSVFETGTRRCPELKWKPEHSLDFLFCATRRADGRVGLAVCYSYGGGIVDACRMLHLGDGHAAFVLDAGCPRLAAWRASVAPLLGTEAGAVFECVVECILRVERVSPARAAELRIGEAAALTRAGGTLAARPPREFTYCVTARVLRPRPDKRYPNTYETIVSTLLQSAGISLERLVRLLE